MNAQEALERSILNHNTIYRARKEHLMEKITEAIQKSVEQGYYSAEISYYLEKDFSYIRKHVVGELKEKGYKVRTIKPVKEENKHIYIIKW